MKSFSHIRGRVRGRISYANVMSTIAVFLALGGISWAAATLPKNSVGTKQLRKSAVNNSDIRGRAVSGPKVRKDTLSGYHINESGLTNVPMADAVATDFTSVYKRVAANGSGATVAAARAAAAEVPLLTHGQITLYAKCYIDTTANALWGEVIARTSADGATAFSTDNPFNGDPEFLNTGTTEVNRVSNSTVAMNNAATSTVDSAMEFFGPDSNGMRVSSTIWIKHGTLPQGSALLAHGDQCAFGLSGRKLVMQ